MKKTIWVALCGFAVGWATRGLAFVFAWPWWLGAVISATLLLAILVLDETMRRRKAAPARTSARVPRSPLEGLPIYASDLVEPGQVIVMNQDSIQKLIRNCPPMAFTASRLVDNDHLPGCLKRHDVTATCICGGRGFGAAHFAAEAMAKLVRETGTRSPSGPTPFLRHGARWSDATKKCESDPTGIGEHRCAESSGHIQRGIVPCRCHCGQVRRTETKKP